MDKVQRLLEWAAAGDRKFRHFLQQSAAVGELLSACDRGITAANLFLPEGHGRRGPMPYLVGMSSKGVYLMGPPPPISTLLGDAGDSGRELLTVPIADSPVAAKVVTNNCFMIMAGLLALFDFGRIFTSARFVLLQ